MEITFAGMKTDCRLKQWLKAASPISTSEEGRSILTIFV